MKLFLIVALFLLNPAVHYLIFAEEELTDFEIKSLTLDENFYRDSVKIEEIFNQLSSIIRYQTNQQYEIENVINEFFDSDMTNEELWVLLDEIYANTRGIVEGADNLVSTVSFTTSSDLEYAKPLHYTSVEILYEMLSHIAKNNKLTTDLIDTLSEGDLDSYNKLNGRTRVINSEFLEIMVKHFLTTAKKIPSTYIQKQMILLEAESLSFNLIVQKINGLVISGDLTKKMFIDYERSLKIKYKDFKNSKSYKNLKNTIINLERAVDSAAVDETSIYAVEQYIISAELYADSLKRETELNNELYLFYKKHIDDLDALNTDPKTVASLDSLLSRQNFQNEETVKYATKYQEAALAVLKVLPDLIK